MSDGGINTDDLIKKHRNSESFGVVTHYITKQSVSYPLMPKSNVSNSTRMVGQNKTIYPNDFKINSNKTIIKNYSSKSKNNIQLPYSDKEILKCVFNLRTHPFGKEHIIDILIGIHTSKIKRYHHERLSVHGKLKGYTKTKLREFIIKLIQDKYMVKSGGARPTITLTQKGIEYLKSLGISR